MTTTPTFSTSQIVFSTDLSASRADVAGLPDNSFLIVWNDGSGDIHGLHLNPLGVAVSGDVLGALSQTTPQSLRLPEVSVQEDGVVRFFYQFLSRPSDEDIYFVRPTADFSSTTSGTFKVVQAPQDEFMRDAEPSEYANVPDSAVVFSKQRAAGSSASDLYLAHVDADGGLIGTPKLIGLNANESVIDAAVAGIGNGTTIVTYHVSNSVTGKTEVRYRIFKDYSDLTNGAVTFNDTPGNDAFPAVTAIPRSSDGFVIVAQQPGSLRYFYSAFGNSFYATVPGTEGSSGNGFPKALTPEITALNDQGFIIAWTDTSGNESDGSADLKVVLQRFGKDGAPIGSNVVINNPGDQSLNSIATLDDGRVVVAYSTETGDSTNQTHLAFRIIDPREPLILGTATADNIVSREDGATILGYEGNDELIGRNGMDRLDGGAGADKLIGGAGNDTYIVDNAGDSLIETEFGGIDSVLASITFSLVGRHIENVVLTGTAVIGAAGNDLANKMVGNIAGNKLVGHGGNDALYGGLGKDALYGGAGNDTFVFDTALNAVSDVDAIYDFANATGDNDSIRLDNAIFSKLGNPGPLAAKLFKDIGTGAKLDIDDRVIYNSAKGTLSYDDDGSGPHKAVLFAILVGHPALTAADFLVT